MNILDAIAIFNADADSGLIGRAARANCPEAYTLIVAWRNWQQNDNSDNELLFIQAVMNWQVANIGEKHGGSQS